MTFNAGKQNQLILSSCTEYRELENATESLFQLSQLELTEKLKTDRTAIFLRFLVHTGIIFIVIFNHRITTILLKKQPSGWNPKVVG